MLKDRPRCCDLSSEKTVNVNLTLGRTLKEFLGVYMQIAAKMGMNDVRLLKGLNGFAKDIDTCQSTQSVQTTK